MKTFLRTTVLCSLFAAVTTVPALRAADDEAPAAADSGASRLEEMGKKLNLTGDQKAKIGPILRKEVADLKALQAGTSMRRMQRLRKARDINNTASEEIRALLTPEQQPVYDEMRAEARAKMKERVKKRKNQEAVAP